MELTEQKPVTPGQASSGPPQGKGDYTDDDPRSAWYSLPGMNYMDVQIVVEDPEIIKKFLG